MYFITDDPKLFNVETGVCISIQGQGDFINVSMSGVLDPLLEQVSRQECEDFIYSIAGWVGAVNPMGNAAKDG